MPAYNASLFNPRAELTALLAVEQLAKPCGLFIGQAGQPLLERQPAHAIFRRQPAKTPLDGKLLQHPGHKFLVKLVEVFRKRLLHGKILLTVELFDLLHHVAILRQGPVALARQLLYFNSGSSAESSRLLESDNFPPSRRINKTSIRSGILPTETSSTTVNAEAKA